MDLIGRRLEAFSGVLRSSHRGSTVGSSVDECCTLFHTDLFSVNGDLDFGTEGGRGREAAGAGEGTDWGAMAECAQGSEKEHGPDCVPN